MSAGVERRGVRVEFECVVCGETRPASVPDEAVTGTDRPVETLHECPTCEMETIWIET